MCNALKKPDLPSSGHPDTLPKVSAIIIARDEARTIGACIQAVLTATDGIDSETVVVDSGSVDATATEVARFPVRLVSITPSVPLSPAIARHVGLQYARGDYILYVDGDTVLVEGWLKEALTTMQSDESLAAVAGACEGIQDDDGERISTDQYPDTDYAFPQHLSGSALYRRSALDAVGGFNPNMRAAEEIELGARLRKAGYRLERLPRAMSRHHRKAAPETVRELLRRVRRGYPIGEGQLWRHTVSFDLPQPDAFAQVRNATAFVVLLVAGIASLLLTMYSGTTVPWITWIGLMVCIFAAFAIRSRSIRRPSYYFLTWLIAGPLVVWGMVKRPYSADVFPQLHVTVKDFHPGQADRRANRPPRPGAKCPDDDGAETPNRQN